MPQLTSFCPLCDETCSSHHEICTVCGERLVVPPSSQVPVQNSRNVSFAQEHGTNIEEWETPTAEAMDPQQAQTRGNPTSKECLKRIPRIIIDATSAILYEASIEIEHCQTGKTKQNLKFDATVAEFAPHPPFQISGELHQIKPIHGSLPLSSISAGSGDTILYTERGGGVTFVQKARNAKSLGTIAVICGNHVPVWPYIMKDSAKKASSDDIPILMVKRSDGHVIKEILKKASIGNDGNKVMVKIEAKKCATSCIICTEGFEVGSCVMRLPLCGHVFHEECCMSWLTKHNTCPFCRRELPAENSEYENERRRIGRSHAGAAVSTVELAEDQWESIFG
eukprot:scaffold2154_cov283-Chaetoceros_neogracile.AAC.41